MRYIIIVLTVLFGCVNNTSAEEKEETFPWSVEFECKLGNYAPVGMFPTMLETLKDLNLEHRITRGYDPKIAAWNYHREDYVFNEIKFSAAVDLSIRCLTDDQIKNMLGELAVRGFAAWLRRNNVDGWEGSDHIHAVWASAKLKKRLREQVINWAAGRNGLASNLPYKFWQPNEKQLIAVQTAFEQANQ